MDRKLSFILPVYNVEAYLPQCVASILPQMTEQCELILVDDGSPDGCPELCDQYGREDSRVRVIHKENGGLSSARNAGMEIARGRYLCFVDSDDLIAENTVGKLLAWIDKEKADVCFLKTEKIYPDGTREVLNEALQRSCLHGASRAQALSHLASRPIYPGSAWAKLWKREFLEKNSLRFPGDRRLSEDLIFCLNAYLLAEHMDYLDFTFYGYRQSRAGSITSDISPKYFFDSLLFTQEVCSRFGEDRNSPEGRLALSAGAYEYMIRLWEVGCLQERKAEAWKALKDCRWILKSGSSTKTRMVRWAVYLLGLKGTSGLLGFYQRQRK